MPDRLVVIPPFELPRASWRFTPMQGAKYDVEVQVLREDAESNALEVHPELYAYPE
jgi:hypothetical protein